MSNPKTSEEQAVITDEMAMAGYDAMRDPSTNLPAPWIVLGTAFKVFEAMLEASKQELTPMPNVPREAESQQVSEAKERLVSAMPYFRNAANKAKMEGEFRLAVVSTNNDGSGRVLMQFAPGDFFEDLALVLGVPAQSAEADLKADALAFLHRHGLNLEAAE
jgi:hypothetical protein